MYFNYLYFNYFTTLATGQICRRQIAQCEQRITCCVTVHATRKMYE